jgi:hypothetical protein
MSGKLIYFVSFGLLLVIAGFVRADSNLVAHYEFSAEGDYSNSIAGGTAGLPQGDAQIIWDDERDSYVLSLDGDGDYVSYEDEWMGIVGTAITVTAWIKTDSLDSYDGVVGLGYAWRLCGDSDCKIRFQCSDTVPAQSMAVGSTDVNDGQWHHVAGTYDGAKYTLYVDGMLDASMDATGNINKGGSYFSTIGAHYKKSDERDPRRFFEGLIDDVRIYDKALSEGEIFQIYTFKPGRAVQLNPVDGQTEVDRDIVLTWLPAETAVLHDVYFGADFNDVNNAGPTDTTGIYRGRQNVAFYAPIETLQWETTYYWRIDEVNDVNPDSPWTGGVWSFTVGNYLVVDDFESYDLIDNPIWYIWKDGLGYGTPGTDTYYPGNGTGSSVGIDETLTSEPMIVRSGVQSMPYSYDNNKESYAKYSEAEMTLSYPRDWTEEDVIELSLWFIGRPAYAGNFVEGPAGTYTMTGSGTDIWGLSDEFHFAFQILSGPGSIIAKVESVENTNDWSKAGVMIRETLEPSSTHVMMAVTPSNGVWFGWRKEAGKDSYSQKQDAIIAPHWVKLERNLSGDFRAYHSSNGSTWQALGAAQNIQMNKDVYIGLALSSHDTDLTCRASFSNITISGMASSQWADQDIGIESNDPEPMYVVVSNISGEPAVVYNEDPNAITLDVWTEWRIPLQTFANQGIDLTDVDKIAIGFGTKGNMTIPGGSGKMFFDDIRLYRSQPDTEQ